MKWSISFEYLLKFSAIFNFWINSKSKKVSASLAIWLPLVQDHIFTEIRLLKYHGSQAIGTIILSCQYCWWLKGSLLLLRKKLLVVPLCLLENFPLLQTFNYIWQWDEYILLFILLYCFNWCNHWLVWLTNQCSTCKLSLWVIEHLKTTICSGSGRLTRPFILNNRHM